MSTFLLEHSGLVYRAYAVCIEYLHVKIHKKSKILNDDINYHT